MTAFYALIRRDLLLAFRFGADTLATLLFFVLCGSLFPLALGPSPDLLRHMGPGIIWVCALLASLLPLDRLFGSELDDGSLDFLMLTGLSAPWVALAKMIAHWLTTGLPLIVASLPLGLMLGVTEQEMPILLISLTLGTLCLSLVGGMAACIVLGARRGGVLLPLLVLPLATPVLIFGAAASYAPLLGTTAETGLDLLGACLMGALPLSPLAAGQGLKAATE
ncbi:heme exporter protein CcmB [Neokomagataea tanensis]|uniref:Heme exporter protein B n=1 Tax=Neokomagataea tanensis TaxID=661191 RepID=A0A4Y6V8A2_9PROT|nr:MULTISPECIES: heme exporter protein CcmB [Neokomagataea]QDH25108.1 heme exporter protein CcmB [Neokomagataea tanensis]